MRILDREAYRWRVKHRREIEAQAEAFLERAYRRSRSLKSREAKLTALSVFCGFLRMLPNQVVEEVKSGRSDPYRILDDFVTYLSRIGVAPHSIKDYVSGVRKWLVFNDVEVESAKLREKVELPRQYSITVDKAPTKEELKRMLMAADLRGKALIACLASSGMRIGELLSLRVKDVDFEKHPVRIYVRAEIAKDRQARYCFLSDEAAEILKQYLGERINDPESYIFQGRQQGTRADGTKYLRGGLRNGPMSYWNADTIFTNVLKKAGLYAKDEHGRDVIHIHSLRKFFFTQLLPVLGRDVTQALMGHKEYLDQAYRRFTVEQLAEQYSKAMRHVTIMSTPIEEEKVRKEAALEAIRRLAEVFGIDPLRIKIEREKELGKELSLDEEVQLLQNEIKKIREGSNDPQKIVSEEELEKHLKEGWEFVSVLPSRRIIIRRKS